MDNLNCKDTMYNTLRIILFDILSFQATPDLLKGQQDVAHQTNEETAKQILYNYLKEGLVNIINF